MRLDIEKHLSSGKKPYYVIGIWERTHTDCYRTYTTKEIWSSFYNAEVDETTNCFIQDYINVWDKSKELKYIEFEYKPQKINVGLDIKDYERVNYYDYTKKEVESVVIKTLRKKVR